MDGTVIVFERLVVAVILLLLVLLVLLVLGSRLDVSKRERRSARDAGKPWNYRNILGCI